MLNELSRYENLGTPGYFYELFRQIVDSGVSWSQDDVRAHFYNRIVEGRAVFDGCLPLAEAIGAIHIDENRRVRVNPALAASLINEKYFSNRMLEMIVLTVKNDDIFHSIFCAENISYDIIYRLIQIDNAAFLFRYGNFRQLLVNFSFLYAHPDRNIRKLIISTRHKRLFDSQLMPEIKKRKLGIAELEKMLAQRQINGRAAEDFVLGFERERLKSHPTLGRVEIISEYDVAAGYDIVSYESHYSEEHDRFIEVKSFSSKPSFHWSRNEIDVARIKKDSYFLYLVDREKMSRPSYAPLMIQNPHEMIIENGVGWEKLIEGYFVTQM